MGREEIPVGCADVTRRRSARSPAQHQLIAHELAVIFSNQSLSGLKSGICDVRTRSPLPYVSEDLLQSISLGGLWVKNVILEESTLRWIPRRGNFPLFFQRQSGTRPARVCVRLVKTHVADWFGGVHWFDTRSIELQPRAVVAGLPIEGRIPTIRANRIPPIGKPEFRPVVTVIGHELHVLRVGHGTRSDLKRPQQDFMPRTLVVECETLTGVTNGVNPSLKLNPGQLRSDAPGMRLPRGFGRERPRPQRVLDVSNDQLLMLLLMIQSQFNEIKNVFATWS